MKTFWTLAEQFTIYIRNITVFQSGYSLCWDVELHYIYNDDGIIEVKVKSVGGVCAEKYRTDEQKLSTAKSLFRDGGIRWHESLLQISIMLLATLDAVLGIKYIYEVIEMYTKNIYLQKRINKMQIPEYKLRKDENLTTLKIILKQQKPWQELTFRERMLFFDLYLPIRIVGNICQIVASGIVLSEGFVRVDDLATYDEIFVGLGCFIAWFSIAKYMEYFPGLHIIVSVLEGSIIPLCMAIISFFPVFVAYLILGMCIFGQSQRFATVHSSFVSLAALVYGDSVSDIILETSMEQNLKLTMFYMVSYILLFIFAVNNIMVALIKEQQDFRREAINIENLLMNSLDIKPTAPQPHSHNVHQKTNLSAIVEQSSEVSLPNRSILEEQSLRPMASSALLQRLPSGPVLNRQESSRSVTMKDLDNDGRQNITLNTVAKLAVTMSKGDRMSSRKLQSDWSTYAGQEIVKSQLYNSISSVSMSIKDQLQQMESELRNELSYQTMGEIERIEVITFYCSQLLALSNRIRKIAYNIQRTDQSVSDEQALESSLTKRNSRKPGK